MIQAWVLAFLTGNTDSFLAYTYLMAKSLLGGFSIYSAHYLASLICVVSNTLGDVKSVMQGEAMRRKGKVGGRRKEEGKREGKVGSR
jgi:hypothetical protein